jgi:UDP:flavonoid glycosyltransferase YjiC (YdhE family)
VHDQPDSVVRVCRLGVGETLSPKNYRIKTILDRLYHIWESPTAGESCRRRAADLATNTAPDRTCTLIEQLGRSKNS